jgi:hypothetical protein
MKKLRSTFSVLMVIVLFAIIQVIPVFSQSVAAQNSGNSSVSLTYKYPSDVPVHYITNQKIIQVMDVEGQKMQVTVTSVNG